jgi:putative transposase
VLAQVEIVESNSLIESWWQNLKHSWLFINALDSRAAVQRLVTFYVREYNEIMPHGALDWRTPDEVYFGRAEDVSSKLDVARRAAREARLTANRATTCETCRGSPASSTTALSEAA